jgi:hypothetical protein
MPPSERGCFTFSIKLTMKTECLPWKQNICSQGKGIIAHYNTPSSYTTKILRGFIFLGLLMSTRIATVAGIFKC